MPNAGSIDLRPMVASFLEQSRKVDVCVETAVRQEWYRGLFDSAVRKNRKIKIAKEATFQEMLENYE